MIARSVQAAKDPSWLLRSMAWNHLLFLDADERRTLETVRPYTLLGIARLRALLALSTRVVSSQIPGAFVECGTWNGGSGALLAKVAARDGRLTWLFDSFEGLPVPSRADLTGWGESGKAGDLVGSELKVREALGLAGIHESRVRIIKGWFEDTLRATATGPIALLHIDVDWAASTTIVLATLYDRISPGGIVVVDDYGFWRGLKGVIDEFVGERGLRINRWAYPSAWFSKR